MQKLVILGGSHAYWEIKELIEDINDINPTFVIIGVLDDNESIIGKRYENFIVEGPIDKAHDYEEDVMFVFAIGSHRTRIVRSKILERLNIPDERFVTLVHPTAKIFKTAIIKHGCIIHYGTVIFNHTVVESFSIISANCVIAVGNYIGKGALFGSNITTTTGVKVGSFSFIGSSTSIGENIEIGPGAQIGMGSLVLKNIMPGSFVLGNPLRVLDKIEVPELIIKDWEIVKENNKLI